MFGIARLNNIAKNAATSAKSFSLGAVTGNTTTGNQISVRGIQYIGINSGTYYYASARALSSVNGTLDLVTFNGSAITVTSYNNPVNLLPYTSEVVTAYGNAGTILAGFFASGAGTPLLELWPSIVTGWTTGAPTGTLTNGTVQTATAEASTIAFHLAMTNSRRGVDSMRPGWFYKSSATNITFRNATMTSGSNALTMISSNTTIETGLSSTTGNFLSASGFATDSNTNYAYALGHVGATDTTYNIKIVTVNTATVRQSTNVANNVGVTISSANIDTVRDVYAAGTGTDSTLVACMVTSTDCFLQSVTVSNWNSFTTAATVSATGSYSFGSAKPLARFVAVKGKQGSGYVISRTNSTSFSAQEIDVALDGTITLVDTAITLTTSTTSTANAFSAEVIFDGTYEVIAIQFASSTGFQKTAFWKSA